MSSSSISPSISEESVSGDGDNYHTPPPKFIPSDDDFESRPGSSTPEGDRSLAETPKLLLTKGSCHRPLREIRAPNRSLRSTHKEEQSRTAVYTNGSSEVSECNFSPAAGHSLDELVHTFGMKPKRIPAIESLVGQTYYRDKAYIAVSSPRPDGTHRAKVGRLGMTSHLQRVAAYQRCDLHIVATLGVASSQRVEKLVMGLLKSNFKWKEAGDTDNAPYFQQMLAMGRKIPCPCGKGHDDVFLTSSSSHTYLESLLLWARDRDFADKTSAELISEPIERFKPPGLCDTVQQEDNTPLSPSGRRETRLQKRRAALLETRGTKKRKRSEGNKQWVRDRAARLVRSPVQRKE
ncbi:hypothetical protein EV426DRAFT_705357 [Tirmania nivea]|nr:hypothetical protein EV426DRAFT_705357 [Tirmania nivea]